MLEEDLEGDYKIYIRPRPFRGKKNAKYAFSNFNYSTLCKENTTNKIDSWKTREL